MRISETHHMFHIKSQGQNVRSGLGVCFARNEYRHCTDSKTVSLRSVVYAASFVVAITMALVEQRFWPATDGGKKLLA